MAETILGIDVGSSCIKMVQIERTLQGTVLKKAVRVPTRCEAGCPASASDVPAADKGATEGNSPFLKLARSIVEAVEEHGLSSDRIVLGVSLRTVFLRQLRFPFSRSAKIAQVLDFELEGQLPIPMEDVFTVFRKEEKTATGEQAVLAGAMLIKELEGRIEAFRAVKLNLEIIDLSWHGTMALLRHESGVVPQNVILVDLGWNTTEVLLVRHGRIVAHRFAPSGMRAFVPEEVRNRWNEQGEMLPFVDLSEDAIHAWARQIKPLIDFLTMSEEHSDTKTEQLVLCGGGSLVPGMDSALEVLTHIPAQCIEHLKTQFFSVLPDLAGRASLFHAAAGLALRAGMSDLGFNFRTGIFAPQTTFKDRKKRLVGIAVGFLLVVGVYAGTLISGLYAKEHQLDMLNQEIQSLAHTTLPNVRQGMRPAQYISILKDRLGGEDGQDLGDEQSRASAIKAMGEISSLVDTTFKVTLGMMTLDGRKVRLSGSADGFATVETMKQRLQSSPIFSNVVIKGAKSVGKDGSVQFTLELDRVA